MANYRSKLLIKTISKGFTLVEVMVALAILSIAMVASMVTTKSVMQNGIYIEKKILAHWAAMNILNKAELKMLNQNRLEVSKLKGEYSLRGQEFKWSMNIQKVVVDKLDLLRIQVSVFDKGDANQNEIDSVSRNVVSFDN